MATIYIILGCKRSGRREVIFDLIDGGLAPSAPVTFLTAPHEEPASFDEQIAALPNVENGTWQIENGAFTPSAFSEEAENIFVMTEGDKSPIDALEAIAAWMKVQGHEIGRILTVVHCQLAEKEPKLQPWFEACIHFSDYVLLNRRNDVSNKWIREFENYYKSNCFPCIFEFVKKGKVRNPPQVLDTEPRRLSHLFDESDGIDELEIDEDNLPDEVIDITAPVDPYFATHTSGHRVKKLPDIKDHLED